MTTRTPSQRGAWSRAKGAKFERDLARALKPWFPDAKRGRDNGFRSSTGSAPDLGDLDLGTPEFFVSAKADMDGATDAAWSLGAWFLECQAKATRLDRTGVLIQKRPGYGDPLDAWAWVTLTDLVGATGVGVGDTGCNEIPVRLALRDWLVVLERNGLSVAYPTLDPQTGPQIDVDALDPLSGGVLPKLATSPPGAELA
jgi:hypothetical protein